MYNTHEHITKATTWINKAIAHDQNGNYESALDCYSRGLMIFSHVLKTKQSEHIEDTLLSKMVAYRERAEELVEMLENTYNGNVNQQQQQKQSQHKKSAHHASPKLLENRTNGSGGDSDDSEGKSQNQYSNKKLKNLPKVTFDDIIGNDEIKCLLNETITLPYEMPHLFTGNRKPAQSILLYGPPGNGKTELARALAGTSQMNFYPISSSDIISKYVGESERNIKELFDEIKSNTPCILFIDELDSMCTKRVESSSGAGGGGGTKSLQQFLVQLDGICETNLDGVLILGATNIPWELDPAMMRRFSHSVLVPLPNKDARSKIFEKYISKNEHSLLDLEFNYLGLITENYSASDIANACRSAAMAPIRRITKAKKFHHNKTTNVYIPCHHHDDIIMMNGIGCSNATCINIDYSMINNKNDIPAGPILFRDVKDALEHHKSTIDLDQLKKTMDWKSTK